MQRPSGEDDDQSDVLRVIRSEGTDENHTSKQISERNNATDTDNLPLPQDLAQSDEAEPPSPVPEKDQASKQGQAQ